MANHRTFEPEDEWQREDGLAEADQLNAREEKARHPIANEAMGYRGCEGLLRVTSSSSMLTPTGLAAAAAQLAIV